MRVYFSEIEPKMLPEKIVFYIRESRSSGTPDEHSTKTLKYADVDNLPPFPPDTGLKSDRLMCHQAVLFWIPKAKKWIAFDFRSEADRDYGPNDESFEGPYLFTNELPPAKQDLICDKGDTSLVTRIHNLPKML